MGERFRRGLFWCARQGAPGKLLLAYHYPPESAQFNDLFMCGKITRLTDRTLTDRRRLQTELNKIQRLGYATSDGEAIRGTIGIAAPVWNSTARVEAALALTAVESLCDMKHLLKYLPDLRRTAENISKALGYGTGKKPPAEPGALIQHRKTTIIDTLPTVTVSKRNRARCCST